MGKTTLKKEEKNNEEGRSKPQTINKKMKNATKKVDVYEIESDIDDNHESDIDEEESPKKNEVQKKKNKTDNTSIKNVDSVQQTNKKTKEDSQKIIAHSIPSSRILEIVTTKGTAIKSLIESLSSIVPETVIICSPPNGDNVKGTLKISALNTAHTAIANITLDNFDIFHCPKKIKLGVDMINFYRYIKGVGNDDTLTLYLDKNNENHLGIIICGKNQKIRNKTELNLLEIKDPFYKIPQSIFTRTILMPAKDFQKMCKNMAASHINKIDIIYTSDEIRFVGHSEGGKQSISMSNNDDSQQQSTDGEIIQGTYELKNLLIFSKCSIFCDNIQIYMKNDSPLYIIYRVAELGKVIWIATNIDSKDE